MQMILIFSGYNQRAVIAFLRTLESNRIRQYRIIAASPQDTILKTKYRTHVFAVRKKRQLDLDEVCKLIDQIHLLETFEKVLIVPSTEALNRFILRYRDVLEKHNTVIPLVKEELYIRISDKQKFWELCNAHDFLVPKQSVRYSELLLPIVAKPLAYVSENGKIFSPVIINSENEWRDFTRNFPVDDFVLQEFIYGKSYYLLFYFSRSGDIYCLSQRNLAQQPKGKSIVAACISRMHEKSTVTRQYADMLKELGFHGLLMIELRETNNGFYMIEANPRFWGPSQLFCNSAFNFFEFFLHDYGILKEVPKRQIDYTAKYLWSGGIKGEILRNDDCIWLEGGRKYVSKHLQEFLENDIYDQPDTSKIYKEEAVIQQYKKE